MNHRVQTVRAKRQPIGESFDNVLARGKRYYRDRMKFMMVKGSFTWEAVPVPYNGKVPDNAIVYSFDNGKWAVA